MQAERFFASMIDFVLAAVVAGLVFTTLFSTRLFGLLEQASPIVAVAFIFFFARVLPILVLRRSLGEKLLKLRRVERDGSPVSPLRQLFTVPRYAGQRWEYLP